MKTYMVVVRHYGSAIHYEKWWTYKRIEANTPEEARDIAVKRALQSKVFTNEKGFYKADRVAPYDLQRLS